MEPVLVSVLVPVLDEEAHLRTAVAAMLAQDVPGRFELLCVDGGSADRSLAVLAELAAADDRVVVLHNPARRTPHALNIGLRAARGTYVARMDAHTYYPPGYLRAGVERLARGDAAWVSGPQLAEGTSPGSRRTALALSTPLGVGGAAFRRALTEEVEVDSGFCGMWRRETLERHGGWDEGSPVDQDYELAARMRAQGERIVCIPAMAASYVPRDGLRPLARQYAKYGFYRVRTSRRHPWSLRRSQLLPPAVAATAVAAAAAPRPVRTLARAGVAAYAAGLGAVSVRAARTAGPPAAALPAVFATMHLAYGAGFLVASAKLGPPAAAVRAALRPLPGRGGGSVPPRAATRWAVHNDEVYRRDGDALYADRAFSLFQAAVGEDLERLVRLGRLHPEPGTSHYRLPAGTELAALPAYGSLTRPRELAAATAGSLKVVWRTLGDVDGIWLLGPHPLGLAFAGLAAVRGRHVALGVRQDLPVYARSRHPDARWVHRAADVLEAAWRRAARRWPVVVVGPALARQYAAAPRLCETHVSLVRDADVLNGTRVPSDWCAGELRVLSAGRLEEEKNPLLLADVLAALHEHDPRWRLEVCGEGPLAGDLLARLDALGLRDHARVRGYVPFDELMRRYRDSHAFLHVSWTEGLPQVLYEAFASGTPVVATDVGGVAPVAAGAALLVPPGDAGAAAAALTRLAAEPGLRAELTGAGTERARRRTLDAEARRVAAFLRAAGEPA